MSTSSKQPISREFKARKKPDPATPRSAVSPAPVAQPAPEAKAAPGAKAAIVNPPATAANADQGAKDGSHPEPVADAGLKERRQAVRKIPVPEVTESESDSDWAAFQELVSEPAVEKKSKKAD